VTTKKGYLADVPPLSRVSDIICIPFGAQVPFVLREVKEKENMRVRRMVDPSPRVAEREHVGTEDK
jgi:hypothetical protein